MSSPTEEMDDNTPPPVTPLVSPADKKELEKFGTAMAQVSKEALNKGLKANEWCSQVQKVNNVLRHIFGYLNGGISQLKTLP